MFKCSTKIAVNVVFYHFYGCVMFNTSLIKWTKTTEIDCFVWRVYSISVCSMQNVLSWYILYLEHIRTHCHLDFWHLIKMWNGTFGKIPFSVCAHCALSIWMWTEWERSNERIICMHTTHTECYSVEAKQRATNDKKNELNWFRFHDVYSPWLFSIILLLFLL